jgi:hypothetical protein
MGCRAARSSFSEENTYLFKQETALGFSSHSPTEIEAICYRLSQNSLLSDSAFLRFRDSLGVTKDPEVAFSCFERMKDGEMYDASKVLTYALMLSRGAVQEKAKALWNVYKQDGGVEMQQAEFRRLLEGVLAAALDYSLELSVLLPAMGEDRLKAWRETMKPKQTKAVAELMDMFIGKRETLHQATYLRLIGEESSADITSTAGLRDIVERVKAAPAKYQAAFQKHQFANKLV